MDTISFLSPMVKAIIDGKKTVTRRPLKMQPPDNYNYFGVVKEEVWFSSLTREEINNACAGTYFAAQCPYGKVNDILSINEPWQVHKTNEGAGVFFEDGMFYVHSEAVGLTNGNNSNSKWRSPKSLPKWASRYQIKISKLKVERLQDITDKDILREGMYLDYLEPSNLVRIDNWSRKDLFILYWELCYNKTFPWDSNPWVWVLDFDLITL